MGHQLDGHERMPLSFEVEELAHVEVEFASDQFPFVYREKQLVLQDLIRVLLKDDQF